MAKRVAKPSDTTSYNKYGVSKETQTRPIASKRSIASESGISPSNLGEYIVANSSEVWHINDMSPYYLYSVKEVAVILKKAEDTIRKESQHTGIGTHKEGRYWFNSKEVEDLKKSFEEKRKNHLLRTKPEEESLVYALFQRLTKMEHILGHLITDRERFRSLLFEWMQDLRGRVEDLEKRR